MFSEATSGVVTEATTPLRVLLGGLELFLDKVFRGDEFDRLIGNDALELRNFIGHRAHFSDVGRLHRAELFSPLVNRVRRYAMFSGELCAGRTGIKFCQNSRYLFVAES